MQPDPALFLSGARRSLLKILQGSEITDPVTRITLDRIAEALAHLSLRDADLPGILEPLVEDQRRLLGAPVMDGESPVRAWDRQSRDIAARVADGAGEPFVQQARDLEGRMRAAYRHALAGLKSREAARAPTDDDLGREPPTPEQLAAYIAQKTGQKTGAGHVTVSNLRQLIAVNSKDIIFFDVDGVPGWPASVVFRRLRGFSVNDLASMTYEANLLKVMGEAGVPGPRPLLVDETGGPFGAAFMMMERVPGAQQQAASLGAAGRAVAEDIAQVLARIHQVDPILVARPTELALGPHERILRHIERHYDQWRANSAEPSATVEAAYAWVRRNVAVLSDATVLVHGDVDLRNMLIEDGRLSAVLDWERSHVGHPAEDLAYLRRDIEALVPWEEFLGLYYEAGGHRVTEEMLRFFLVWGNIFRTTIASRAHYGYFSGEHDDILVGSVGFIEFNTYLDTLRDLI